MAFSLVSNDKVDEKPYSIKPERWYKAFPYGFAFWTFDAKQKDLASETFWLPIAPNNISIVTHFATNIVTTLYGVVEEHSEVRYYDITISGNTGIAPRFTTPFSAASDLPATDKDGFGAAKKALGKALPNLFNPGAPSTGRDYFRPDDLLNSSTLKGFLPEVTNTINAAANLVKGVLGDDPNKTGIKPEQSGYYAFHNFYKFLLRYKQDTSRTGGGESGGNSVAGAIQAANNLVSGMLGKKQTRQTYPLQFMSYKDNVKYDVIPISFTLVRSAENPMLYIYTIKMRGFNLQNVTAKPPDAVLLNDLGLGSLEGSLFADITGKVGKASTLISGISGAF